MKTSKTTLALCLLVSGTLAQTATTNYYYVTPDDGKTVVKTDGRILNSPVPLGSHALLMSNGEVIWGDKSITVLHSGDCIDESGIIYTHNEEVDFTGDQHALNHIHMLPEVSIEGKKINHAQSNKGYIAYMKKAYGIIQENDYQIAIIKEKLLSGNDRESKKYLKKIRSLEKENLELKVEFDSYVHYGQGDWSFFRDEFNEELQPVVQDLKELNATLL